MKNDDTGSMLETKFSLKNFMEMWGIKGRVVLEQILGKQFMRIWIVLNYLRIVSSCGSLWWLLQISRFYN